MDTYETFVALVDDDTPETLAYGDYRGWVLLDGHGQWIRNLSDDDAAEMGSTRVEDDQYSEMRAVVYFPGHAKSCLDRDRCTQPTHMICPRSKYGETHHMSARRDDVTVCTHCKVAGSVIREDREQDIA